LLVVNIGMLRHYQDYLRAKCEVVSIGGIYVYPIFRVGYTSLMADADMVFTDIEIDNCPAITVLLRNPNDRFISGINEYCRQKNKGIKDVYAKVQKGKLVDRHFMPQYFWLLHLYTYYKGAVILKPFEYISEITQRHHRANESHQHVEPIDRYTKVDRYLLNNVNSRVSLQHLIRKYKDVLS